MFDFMADCAARQTVLNFSPYPGEIGMALAKAESTPDANARCRCPSSGFAAESLFRIRSQVARSVRGPLPFPGTG
jgi:hypothetical protein